MKVLLNDYVEHLGERGDAVTVRPGYARNYLIPKKLAYPDTPGNRKRFQEEQTRWEELDLQRRGAAEKYAAELDGVSLHFERRAGENDALFGSVSINDIAGAMVAKGYDVDRRKVRLESPIKELGRFEVEINVHRDVSVSIPLQITRPGEAASDAKKEEAPAVEEATVEDVGAEAS